MKNFFMGLALILSACSAQPVMAQTQDDVKTAVIGAAAGAVTAKAIAPEAEKSQQLDCSKLNVTGLSDQQVINLKDVCEAQKAQAPAKDESSTTLTPDNVREWGSLSKEFGQAIASTTKELGVQVNDFLVTPAGILITLYLFWSKLGGILVGIPLLIFVWSFILIGLDRFRRTPEEYDNIPVLFGLWNRRVVKNYKYNNTDNVAATHFLVGFAGLVASAVIIGTVIF